MMSGYIRGKSPVWHKQEWLSDWGFGCILHRSYHSTTEVQAPAPS